MPAILLWDEAAQNRIYATEILTLQFSTLKNKAEKTLQNHEKTTNFDKDALDQSHESLFTADSRQTTSVSVCIS